MSKEILSKLPKLLNSYLHPFYMGKYYDRKAGFIAGYKAAVRQIELQHLKQKEDKQ